MIRWGADGRYVQWSGGFAVVQVVGIYSVVVDSLGWSTSSGVVHLLERVARPVVWFISWGGYHIQCGG